MLLICFTEVEHQLEKKIKFVRLDRVVNIMEDVMKTINKWDSVLDILKRRCGTVAQYAMPGTLEHNGVAERRNSTLVDTVRSMMRKSNLSEWLSCEALRTEIIF